MLRLTKPTLPNFSRVNLYLTVGILVLILLFLCPPLIYLRRQGAGLDQLQTAALIFLPLIALVLLGFGGGALLQRRMERQQAAALDHAFTQFGMRGHTFLLPGSRRFSGLWHGREIDVLFQPAQLFEWQLSTRLTTYWKISNQQLSELAAVLLDPFTFGGGRLYAYGTQLIKLAHQPAVIQLLERLLLQDSPFHTRSLELRDGRLIYRQSSYTTIAEFRPSAATIEQMMNDLLNLLNRAETLAKH